MTEATPKTASRRYISPYLNQPLRSLKEAQEDRDVDQTGSTVEERKHKSRT